LVTGVTSLLVLFALMFLGGDTLWGFSVTLIIGILVGTYSSIWVAASFSLLWEDMLQRRRDRHGPNPPRAAEGKARDAKPREDKAAGERKAAAGGRRR
jgi:Protein export membrane protein